MQYDDVHNILPKSFGYRHISPANAIVTPENSPHYYKQDYKTPFIYSRYFQRKLTPHPQEKQIYTSVSFTDKQKAIKDKDPDFNRFSETPLKLGLKNTIEIDFNKGDVKQNIREMVRSFYSSSALSQQHQELTVFDKKPISRESLYNIISSPIGYERGVNAVEGNMEWESAYFNNLQKIFDLDDFYKEEYDNKIPMYVGRTKKWQAIPDFYGKDEVNKVQMAIGAPVQEQLDLWEEENENRFLEMPICNENQIKFRDVPEHFENLDHDYDNIVYERTRNQAFENMRNTPFWKLEKSDNHAHH